MFEDSITHRETSAEKESGEYRGILLIFNVLAHAHMHKHTSWPGDEQPMLKEWLENNKFFLPSSLMDTEKKQQSCWILLLDRILTFGWKGQNAYSEHMHAVFLSCRLVSLI